MFQAVVVSSLIISFFLSMLLFRMVGMITYKNTDEKSMIVSNVGTTTRSENVCQGNDLCGVIMHFNLFFNLRQQTDRYHFSNLDLQFTKAHVMIRWASHVSKTSTGLIVAGRGSKSDTGWFGSVINTQRSGCIAFSFHNQFQGNECI